MNKPGKFSIFNKNAPAIIFFLTFAVVIGTTSRYHARAGETERLNTVLSSYGITIENYDFSVTNSHRFTARGKTFHTLTAHNGTTRIELEITVPLEETEAPALIKDKYTVIQNLYGPQLIPYTGTLTTTTDCPPDKKPEHITAAVLNRDTTVLLANATERYVLGVWDNDLIKQKAAVVIFYDKNNKTNYQIMLFQPCELFDRKEILSILHNIKNI